MKKKSRSVQGSIYAVAKAAGVSIGTVSRVFNEKPDVADDTRRLVLEAAKRVSYMPRISRRRLNVGLVVEEIENANQVGYVSDVVSTLAKHMALRDGVLELIPMNDPDALYRNYVQGAIVIAFGPDTGRFRDVRNIPVVFINNRPDAATHHMVASDHAQGARQAVRHLLKRGHRRIGFLEVLADTWGARERLRGYREAFKEQGVKPPADLVRYCGGEPALHALAPLLEKKPTALLACGEDLSLEVSRLLLHELEVEIPGELSLVTYETPLVSSILTPPQTTVSQPWEDIGRHAVECILACLENHPAKPIRTLLPNRLIERRSVRSV